MTGNGLILRVWISVIASNNSSSVPNPPGKITNAIEYFTNITFRTKKYRNFGEHFEAFNKFGDDSKNSPGVLTREIVDDVLFFNSISFHDANSPRPFQKRL